MRTISELGRGGFGLVQLVEDDYGNRFAKKTFQMHPQVNFPQALVDNARKRFIREAEVQSSIQHPNILSVFNVHSEGDNPSYLMPVAMATLSDDIKNNTFVENSGLSPILDIISALEELHSMGIYHRDLKPQNVLRLQDNQGKQYYAVSDFGLIATSDTQISVLTTTGMQKGSDHYTAPEITTDLRRASPASDIFSVGCILHDIFGVGEPRIPCTEIDEDKSRFADIIRSCTRSKANKRFQSVSDLREAILDVDLDAELTDASGSIDYQFLLDETIQMSQMDWIKFCESLPSKDESERGAIFLRLPMSRIDEIIATDTDAASLLGQEYASWARTANLAFSSCDGIANRLERFLLLDNITTKAEVILALLFMGTSHNRWYVERLFVKHFGPSLDESLAKRLSVELRVLSTKACRAISHLEYSIKCSRDNFHPLIVSTLESVCGS